MKTWIVIALFWVLTPVFQSTQAAQSVEQATFWYQLSRLCGQAFEGRLVNYDETLDADWLPERMVIEVRRCHEDEIHIPLHVGENRSRVWVLTRHANGLRLKHDHRYPDGREEAVTWYGGHTTDSGRSWRQVFPVDDYSKLLFLTNGLPGSVTNLWYMEVQPAQHFAYGLVREGRHLRAEFDLSQPIEAPPPPWRHQRANASDHGAQ